VIDREKYILEYTHKLRAERKANGLCIVCGGSAEPGFVNCSPCREHRETIRRRARAAQKALQGRGQVRQPHVERMMDLVDVLMRKPPHSAGTERMRETG
jgi:hypothetical protein